MACLQKGDTEGVVKLFRCDPDLIAKMHGYWFLDGNNSGKDELSTALRGLFGADALREAMDLFVEVHDREPTIVLPDDVHQSALYVMGKYGQLDFAVSHVRRLIKNMNNSRGAGALYFNVILSGLLQGSCVDAVRLAERVVAAMVEADISPDSETLGLMIDAYVVAGLPGFLTEVGRTLLNFVRQFGIDVSGTTMLSVSAAHLRSGDLDAAYRWFLASQLSETKPDLGAAASVRTREFVSQFARALAVSGQARRLHRLLNRINNDHGCLPPSVAAVSLAGYTCGRSLATVWLEPPAEVLRRREVWSGNASTMTVTCAEQSDWPRLDMSRHAVYQWSPYLTPDTKVERAWLMPLGMTEHGALGLVCDWNGEGPAATVARERLSQKPSLQEPSAGQDVSLARALKMLPPQQPGLSDTLGSFSFPELRTWRVHHADVAKRAFLTPARINISSPSHLKDILAGDASTRLMLPGSTPSVPPRVSFRTIQIAVQKASAESRDSLLELNSSGEVKGKTTGVLLLLLEDLGLKLPASTKKAELVELVQHAMSVATGSDKLTVLSQEEFKEYFAEMSEEALEESWLSSRSGVSSEVLDEALAMKVENELQRELRDDEQIPGEAADELRLALDIACQLRELGVRLTAADLRALFSAAHCVDEPELAALVLRSLSNDIRSLGDAMPQGVQKGKEEATLGPVGRGLADAMSLGGWERQSAEAFLQGHRPIPARDKDSILGRFLTRYFDPLLGLGDGNEAVRAQLLDNLMKQFEATSENRSITFKIGDDQGELLSARDVLFKIIERPVEVEGHLLGVVPLKATKEGIQKALKALGLPVPSNSLEAKELLGFARSLAQDLRLIAMSDKAGEGFAAQGAELDYV